MMKKTKVSNHIYRHLRFQQHLTYVDVDGKNTPIHFKGGQTSPKKIRGSFETTDPKLIEALEKDEGFGKLYKRIKGEGWEKLQKAEAAKAPVKKVAPKKPAASANNENELTEVAGITTLQEAKEFLVKKVEGIDESLLTTKEAILSAGEEAGYSFPKIQ